MRMYTIGELAGIADISAKTLRFYDQEGLLQPEIRNAANGYRYYSEKQLLQVLLIKELKTFGFSLDEISNVIQQKNHDFLEASLQQRIQTFQKELDQLNQRLMATQFAYQRLQRGRKVLDDYQEKRGEEEGEGVASTIYPVETITLQDQLVLSTRYRSNQNADRIFADRCLELHKLREIHGLFHSGPFTGIFHDGYASQFTTENGDLELCLPVLKPDREIDCPDLKILKGSLCAGTIHIGHYRYSYRAYLILLEWIENSDYRITGPPMEQYLLDPTNTTDSDQFITRIYFPIELK